MQERGEDRRGGAGCDGAVLEGEATGLADVTYSDRGGTSLVHSRQRQLRHARGEKGGTDLERIEWAEADGVEELLAIRRHIFLHHSLDDAHVLALLLLDPLAQGVELLDGILEADQLLVDILVLVVWELSALLLKFLKVLSEKPSSDRARSVVKASGEGGTLTTHHVLALENGLGGPDWSEL